MKKKKGNDEAKSTWQFNINTENEQVILASLWQSAAMRKRILGSVGEKDFIAPRHKILFQAMKQMEEQELVFNEDTLAQLIDLQKAGGYEYLQEIIDAYDVNANIDWHIERLKNDALKYSLFQGEGQAMMEVLTSMNTGREEVLKLANGILNKTGTEYGIQGVMNGESLLEEYLEDFLNRNSSGFVGTGLKELDELLTEGFGKAQVSIIAARPSIGKTVLVANILMNLARKFKVLMCEIETGSISLLDIMVSLHTGIPLESIVKKPESICDKDKSIIRKRIELILRNQNLFFFDDANLTLDRLELELRCNGYDVCFIDLFTRLTDIPSDHKGISEALKRVKVIARLTGTHICLIHQLRRSAKSEKDKRPSLDKLKDSGTFEEVADLVLGLHREKHFNQTLEKDILEISIMKQKRGKSNVVVPYEFIAESCEVGKFVEDWVVERDGSAEDDWP